MSTPPVPVVTFHGIDSHNDQTHSEQANISRPAAYDEEKKPFVMKSESDLLHENEERQSLIPPCCAGAAYFNFHLFAWLLWTLLIPLVCLLWLSYEFDGNARVALRATCWTMFGLGWFYLFFCLGPVLNPIKPSPPSPIAPFLGARFKTVSVKRVYVIYNPFGGSGKAQKVIDTIIIPTLTSKQTIFQLEKTEAVGERSSFGLGRNLNFQGYDALVIAGGDGTLSEFMNGVFSRDGFHVDDCPPVCVIPCGSGNSLTRDLGIPIDDYQLAIDRLYIGHVAYADAVHISDDLGELNGSNMNKLNVHGGLNCWSINEMSWGMAGKVAVACEKSWVRALFGAARYTIMGAWTVLKGSRDEVKLALDADAIMPNKEIISCPIKNKQGQLTWKQTPQSVDVEKQPIRLPKNSCRIPQEWLQWQGEVLTIFVNLAQFFGYSQRGCPFARLDDGHLDICLLFPASRGTLLNLLDQLPKGSHANHPSVRFFQSKSVTLTPTVRHGLINIDGENKFFEGSLKLKCHPLKWSLFVPKDVEAWRPGLKKGQQFFAL